MRITLQPILTGFVLLVFLLSGCGSEQQSMFGKKTDQMLMIDGARIRADLFHFADYATAEVVGISDEIARNTDSSQVRFSALNYKLRAASALQAVVLDSDPRMALVKTWLVAVQQRISMEEGEIRPELIEYQEKLLAMAIDFEDRVEEIVHQSIPEETFETAKKEIERYAREQPITVQTGYGRLQVADVSQIPRKGGGVGEILTLPLAPLTGLQGVSTTADAVDRIGVILGVITEIVDTMPTRIRWQMEAMVLELEASRSMEDLHAALARADEHMVKLQDEIERTVDFVETVPTEVDIQRTQTLADLDQKIADVNSLLLVQRTELEQFISSEREVISVILDEYRNEFQKYLSTEIKDVTEVVEKVPADFVVSAEGGLSRLANQIFIYTVIVVVLLLTGILGLLYIAKQWRKA